MPRLLTPLLTALTLLALPACAPFVPSNESTPPSALNGSEAGRTARSDRVTESGEAGLARSSRTPGRVVGAAGRVVGGGTQAVGVNVGRAGASGAARGDGPEVPGPGVAKPRVRTDYGPGAGAAGRLGAKAKRGVAGALEVERRTRKLARVAKPGKVRVVKPRVVKPRVSKPKPSMGEGRVPGRPRPRPSASVPDVRVYEDAVCVDTPSSYIHIGRCRVTGPRPRAQGTPAPERARELQAAEATPTPTPAKAEPTPKARIVAERQAPPERPNPLGTVLLMVVLTTAIASTTAVAFGAFK